MSPVQPGPEPIWGSIAAVPSRGLWQRALSCYDWVTAITPGRDAGRHLAELVRRLGARRDRRAATAAVPVQQV